MQIVITIEWWENEGQIEIPEDHKNDLEEEATSKISEMIPHGWVAGELYRTVEDIQYNGYWSIKYK